MLSPFVKGVVNAGDLGAIVKVPDENRCAAVPSSIRVVRGIRSPAYGRIHKRGNSFESWAWVELNYRPHAYQATEGE
jgi:hypothetical protein